jgi:hypothetical protein
MRAAHQGGVFCILDKPVLMKYYSTVRSQLVLEYYCYE